jgi:hypothetical protein
MMVPTQALKRHPAPTQKKQIRTGQEKDPILAKKQTRKGRAPRITARPTAIRDRHDDTYSILSVHCSRYGYHARRV